MPKILYVALCLLVPVAWAVLSAHVFDWLEERRAAAARPHTGHQGAPDMYYI